MIEIENGSKGLFPWIIFWAINYEPVKVNKLMAFFLPKITPLKNLSRTKYNLKANKL
ncbi:MAG: hypothetical protein ACMUIP_10185 [bacterium]